MSEEVIPRESLPDEPHVSSTDGEGADDSRITLESLNETLGKDYKDVDTALKSVKETYSFIGKRDDLRQSLEKVMEATGQDEQTILNNLQSLMSQPDEAKVEAPAEPANNFDPDSVIPKSQYLEDRFFDKNPDYEAIKGIIKPLKNTSEYQNMTWDEFKETDTVKNVFETYSVANEAQSKKSVVESNPRLGAAADKMSQARQAMNEGNQMAAKESAVSAVTDLLTE